MRMSNLQNIAEGESWRNVKCAATTTTRRSQSLKIVAPRRSTASSAPSMPWPRPVLIAAARCSATALSRAALSTAALTAPGRQASREWPTASEEGAMKSKKGSGWLDLLVIGGTFAALLWLERRRPLRRAVEPKARREGRNLAVAALSAAAIRLTEKPIVEPLAEWVEQRRWGLLKRLNLPAWLEVPLAVALLDYTLYLWHILVHKVPFLWRFHQPHHVDLDLDASTALRFHFAEMMASVPWLAPQALSTPLSPLPLSLSHTPPPA